MKSSFVLLSVALLLLSLSDAATPSQPPVMSPSPEPSNSIDCSSVIYSMVDCLSFLTVGSTAPEPTVLCCTGIITTFKYDPKCMCSALQSSREMGFLIDDTKALALPNMCNVHIDPHCDVSTPATSTPISSPVKPPTTSPPAKTPSPPAKRPSPPAKTPSPPAKSPSPPAKSPSPPAKTPSPPAKTPSPPAKTPSPPAKTPSPPVSHSSPVVAAPPPAVRHSSPAQTVSSSTATASSPPATSPAPSPSVSSTGILSVSKLFQAVVIVSSFGFILA